MHRRFDAVPVLGWGHGLTTAGEAKIAARAWATNLASDMPGYCAAFVAGSTAGLPDSSLLPTWSDTDVMVVRDDAGSTKAGKFVFKGVLLDGTILARDSLADIESVLGQYHLAHALAAGEAIDDPTGWLTEIQRVVGREYPRRRWVEARCANARESVTSGFQALSASSSLAEQAQAWVFPTGVMTHILLVAGLRNPTVRRRYEAVRDLLAEHGQLGLHEQLLESLGSRRMTKDQVGRHLDAVTRMFDAAALAPANSYRFSSDVSQIARPISIDGSWDMIERGYHREAVFWLIVTGSRALQKLAYGAGPEAASRFEPEFASLLSDLGIDTFDDVLPRREHALNLLPEVWRVARQIMDTTRNVQP